MICSQCNKEIVNKDVGQLHLRWIPIEGQENTEVEPRDKYYCSYNCLRKSNES